MRRWALGCVLLCLAGCGDSSKSVVTGRVTFDDKPVENGAISFVPVNGQTPDAGGTITNGQYRVDVPITEMKVRISAAKVVGQKKVYDTPDSPVMPVTDEALPSKYNEQTELRYTVQKGENKKDWDLKSK